MTNPFRRLGVLTGPLAATLAPYRKQIVRVLTLSAVSDIATLVRPFVYMVLIDRLLQSITVASILLLIAALATLTVVEALFGYFRDQLSYRISTSAILDLGGEAWANLTPARRDMPETWRGNDIVERVNGIGPFYTGYVGVLTSVFISLPIAIVIIVLLCGISPWLACIYVVSIPVITLVTRVLHRRRGVVATESFTETIGYRSVAAEVTGSLELLDSLSASRFAFNRAWTRFAKVNTLAYRGSLYGALITRSTSAAQGLVVAAVLLMAAMLVLAGVMSLGQLVAFDMLSTHLRTKIGDIIAAATRLQTAEVAEQRVRELRQVLAQSIARPAPTGQPPAGRRLRVENITFRYTPEGQPVLQDVGLTLGPGRCIAVTGSSGSGKSTLGRVLSGLATPASMRVTDEGTGETLSADYLRLAVLYMPQEPRLFAGSLAENILLKNADEIEQPDQALALEALRLAALDDEFDLHKAVQEAGRNLSGGQRQRLHLARAFCRQPSIIVIDEPTSALDAKTAGIVMDNLLCHFREACVVVISHDPQVARLADQILHLEDGQLSDIEAILQRRVVGV